DPVDRRHASPDGRPEDDEIERGGQHRRGQALHDGAEPAVHLEQIDGADRIDVHAAPLTRLTKISSSELCWVCRSLKSTPFLESSRSSSAMPVCSAWASKV